MICWLIFDGFGQNIWDLDFGLECRAPMFMIFEVVSYISPLILIKIGEGLFRR